MESSKSLLLFQIVHPLGLKADDLLDEDIEEVTEAIARLDDDTKYERIFRIKRAMDLSLKHRILPKEEWTKPEEV